MEPGALIRPVIEEDAFESLDQGLWAYVEDSAVRQQRRQEAAAELLREYEAEHGEFSDEDVAALELEWRS
jgi:hypothetical protein